MSFTFTDSFAIGTLSLFCNKETREDLHTLKINPVRVEIKVHGYYAQFCFDADSKEEREYTGNVVGFGSGVAILHLHTKMTTLLSCGASKLNTETSSPARPTIIVEKLTVKLDAQQLIYPQFLKKSQRKLKKAQRRLSKKIVKGAKPQSKNYHQKRIRLGKVHQKIQRQRKDWALKLGRCVVASNDVVYEDW
jgi:putative transposase